MVELFSKSLEVKDLSSSVEMLTQKADALIEAHGAAQGKIATLNQEKAQLLDKLSAKEVELERLREENKVLKMASAIKGDEEKVTESKRRISQLVREIDKCLALLND